MQTANLKWLHWLHLVGTSFTHQRRWLMQFSAKFVSAFRSAGWAIGGAFGPVSLARMRTACAREHQQAESGSELWQFTVVLTSPVWPTHVQSALDHSYDNRRWQLTVKEDCRVQSAFDHVLATGYGSLQSTKIESTRAHLPHLAATALRDRADRLIYRSTVCHHARLHCSAGIFTHAEVLLPGCHRGGGWWPESGGTPGSISWMAGPKTLCLARGAWACSGAQGMAHASCVINWP